MKQSKNILQNIPKHNHREPAIDIDKNEFIKLVNSRRSVRVYTDETINPSDIMECLELFCWLQPLQIYNKLGFIG